MNSDLTNNLDVLKRKYVTSFPDKVNSIDELWDSQDNEQLVFNVHKLTGSLGLYGFEEFQLLARTIEVQLSEDNCDISFVKVLWEKLKLGMLNCEEEQE